MIRLFRLYLIFSFCLIAVAFGKENRKPADTCIVDEAAIEDIKSIRKKLEEKEKVLASKQLEQEKKELAIQELLKKLEDRQIEVKNTKELQAKVKEEQIARFVETLLTMSPKSAAKLLTEMPEDLAVAAVSKLEVERLAKVLSAMEPSRASKLSTGFLAGERVK